MSPVLGGWFSTLIMLPLGVFLTRRATQDKGLFEVGNIIEPLKKMFNIKGKNTVSYTFIKSYTNEKLIDVINNYETLGHEENIRYEAIKLLNSRGISTIELRKNGLDIKKAFDYSETISKEAANRLDRNLFSACEHNTLRTSSLKAVSGKVKDDALTFTPLKFALKVTGQPKKSS